MKITINTLILFLFGFLLNAQNTTESPFMEVQGDSLGKFSLLSTEVDVRITGVIADVTVTQKYQNNNDTPVEANYVFPGSNQSAVYGMTMIIGERRIDAEIKEKQEAVHIYEKAKSEGKTASLLEQHRPNVFQMHVANISSKSIVEVELKYTELLIPEDATYEFVYPKAVGPRYVSQKEINNGSSSANPFLSTKTNAHSIGNFDINVSIVSGIPIQEIQSKTHSIRNTFISKNEATIKVNKSLKSNNNDDVIISYRLADNQITSGLTLFEGKEENFFLYMMEPPAEIHEQDYLPREYIFIVDVSGSMKGHPLTVSKSLMASLFKDLKETDLFNVLLFAGGSEMFEESSVPATSENLNKAFEFVDKESGEGSTELLSALKKAMSTPKKHGFSRSIVISTDGFVSVERETFDFIRDNLGKSNFFAFGIGGNPNRYIIEGIARAGNGEAIVVSDNDDAELKAKKLKKYILSPVLTDITCEFKGFNTYDVVTNGIGDLLAQKPVILYGKYKGEAKGKIIVKGLSGKGKFQSELAITKEHTNSKTQALKYLWARRKLEILSDYNSLKNEEKLKSQIIDLSIKYNLLSKFTSFIAVDNEVQEAKTEKKEQKVQQFDNSGSVPEPHEWTLIIIVSTLLIFGLIKKY